MERLRLLIAGYARPWILLLAGPEGWVVIALVISLVLFVVSGVGGGQSGAPAPS